MKRLDLHFKVEVDVDDQETPEKLAEEIRRMLRKMYSVRKVELTSVVENN